MSAPYPCQFHDFYSRLVAGLWICGKSTEGRLTKDATYLDMICVVFEIVTGLSAAIERAVEKDCQPVVGHVQH